MDRLLKMADTEHDKGSYQGNDNNNKISEEHDEPHFTHGIKCVKCGDWRFAHDGYVHCHSCHDPIVCDDCAGYKSSKFLTLCHGCFSKKGSKELYLCGRCKKVRKVVQKEHSHNIKLCLLCINYLKKHPE